jgi:Chloriridovirus ribonuclease III
MSSISKINLCYQKLKLTPPSFDILQKEGVDHHPLFRVSCTFEKCTEIGEGLSLKAAKENAASKIVDMLKLDLKLKELENNITYAIDSYNAPLIDIWESCTNQEYTLTLRKKNKDQYEYKNFKVKILQMID